MTAYVLGSLSANGLYKRDFIGEKRYIDNYRRDDNKGKIKYMSIGRSQYVIAKYPLSFWYDRVYWDGWSTSETNSQDTPSEIHQVKVFHLSGSGTPGFSVSSQPSVSIGISPVVESSKITDFTKNQKKYYTDYTLDHWIWSLWSFQYDVISNFQYSTRSISVSAVQNNKNPNWNTTRQK